MISYDFIRVIEDFVKKNISCHDAAHDWLHIDRVRQLARFIRESENTGDPLITEAAALLHEIGDKKLDKRASHRAAKKIPLLLRGLGFDEKAIKEILFINKNISFSAGYKGSDPSDEFRIVQDADRLDAIGAIGVARAFCYGGFSGAPLYDPAGSKDSTIKHFYDRLLKLKDMMNTKTGKMLAVERHRFMEEFLERFLSEWEI